MKYGGYVKARESLYIQVIIWVNTILNHIDTKAILPSYEGLCMVYWLKWYWKYAYCRIPILYWYQNMRIPNYRYLSGIKKSQYQTNTNY